MGLTPADCGKYPRTETYYNNLYFFQGPKYQPTYRLGPKKPFRSSEVYKILQNIVEREVQNLNTYDSLMGSKIVQIIAAEVRTNVKLLNFDRLEVKMLLRFTIKITIKFYNYL